MNGRQIVAGAVVWGLMAAGIARAETTNNAAGGSEIVVSATRVPTPRDQVASSLTVVTADAIEAAQQRTVADAITASPGVHVARNGGLGSPVGLFLRGAKPEQTLVLVDGIELNDPSVVGRGATLDDLDTFDVARIEVLRGPQSCLYGSDAMGGVVNIASRRGEGPPQATLTAEGGSYDTFRESASLRGGNDDWNYAFGLNRVDSGGFSAANKKDGNTEADGYEQTAFSALAGLTPSDDYGLDLAARYINAKTDFDDAGGPGGDNADDVAKRRTVLLRAAAHAELIDYRWRPEAAVSLAAHDRTFDSAWGRTTFDSRLLKGEWKNDIRIGQANTLTAGLEAEDEQAESDSFPETSANTVSAYVQDQVAEVRGLSAAVGARLDRHEEFGSKATYRVAPMYRVAATGTRIKTTYGTGFKSPSLYQLYAPATSWGPLGNPDLKPETSQSWDIGVEQPLFDQRVLAGVTYFRSRYEDMIDFDNGYVNRSKVAMQGAELYATVQATERLSISPTYTRLDATDRTTGEELVRRPKHRATLSARYRWPHKADLNAEVVYVGKCRDDFYGISMFEPVSTELSSYTLVNLAASYDLCKRMRVFGRIENLFNEEYEESAGYGTAGRSAYAGVSVTL